MDSYRILDFVSIHYLQFQTFVYIHLLLGVFFAIHQPLQIFQLTRVKDMRN